MAASRRRARLSPLAESDLEDIWSYTVENWSLEQAEHYHAGLVDAFEALVRGHKKGRMADIREGYLKYAVGSHVIYYRPAENGIDVIRILHQHMDANRHLL